MAQTLSRAKGLAASAAIAAAVFSGSLRSADVQECNSDSGYAVTTQEMKTDRVIGIYGMNDINAVSLPIKGDFSNDVTKYFGAASLQMNVYVEGVKKDDSTQIYWVQDVITFVYSKGSVLQNLQSEVFKSNGSNTAELAMQYVSGKGALSDQPVRHRDRGYTYIYATGNVPAHMPQSGQLEIKEKLDNGQIVIDTMYVSGYGKIAEKGPETFDRIRLGEQNEFRDAYIFSNKTFDAEIGIGGGSESTTAYFADMNAYVNMYLHLSGRYVPAAFGGSQDASSGESAADLSCRYSNGMVEFYVDKGKNKDILKEVKRLAAEDLKTSN